jgi:hypothetical protein
MLEPGSPPPDFRSLHIARLVWRWIVGILLRTQPPKLRPFYVFGVGAGIVDVT